MKNKLLTLALLSCISLPVFASEVGISLDVDVASKANYRLEENKFVKLYEVGTGNASLKVTVDGNILVDAKEVINDRVNASGEVSIEVLDGEFIRLIDKSITAGRRNNIDQIVKADIKRTFLGKIKAIKVSKDDFLAVYREVLERMGMDRLSRLKIKDNKASISSSLDVSDLDCGVDKNSMVCDIKIDMKIDISSRN